MKNRRSLMRYAALAAVLLAAPAASAGSASEAAGTLLVLNKAENTLAFVDPVAAKVTGKISTGEGPHEVAISSDGKLAFVTNYGAMVPGNSISVVDLEQRKEVKRIDLGSVQRPHGIFELDGKLYFTTETSAAIGRYDLARERLDWVMGTGQLGTHMLVLSPDKKRIYTANVGSDSVSVIELEPGPGKPPVRHIAVGKNPEGLDVSPDGKELWVGQNGDGQISIIDTATGTVKATVKAGQVPIRVKFSPDGRRVFVTDPKANELVVFEAATRKELQRVPVEGIPLGVIFSPDGKRAFVAAAMAGKAIVLDAETLAPVASIETGAAPDGMAYRL